jgi:competence protein ComEC
MTLFYLCIAWMAGIAFAPLTALPAAPCLLAGLLLILLALTLRRFFRVTLFCLALALLGGARLDAARPKPGPGFLGSYLNRQVVLDAVLEEDPAPQGNGIRFRARVLRVIPEEGEAVEDIEGMVLVDFMDLPADWEAHYGDGIRISGFLQPPPEVEGFDYAAYLARQGVYATMRDPRVDGMTPGQGNPWYGALVAFRRRALEILRSLFPEPEGSLLSGILLGEESAIPEEVKDAFSRTGTSHIVAISGFNISIIAGIFLSLTRKMPRRLHGWLIAVAGIILYTVLVGASASVVRAAIMGTLALLARQIGRQSHGLTSLAFSGGVMTLLNPWTIWDAGFQLSATATLGLILFADPMQKAVGRILASRLDAGRAGAMASLASEVFLLTLAAQITTLPILLYNFQSFSLGALLVNPLILPVQPLVMIAGGLALLLGMCWLPAGQALGWLAWAPTAYTIRVVQFGSSFPESWWPVGRISIWPVAAYYAVIFGIAVLSQTGKIPVWNLGRTVMGRLSAVAIPFLAVCAFVAWNAYFHKPDGQLHLTALDSGSGESLLLRAPEGGVVLIDAGGDANAVLAVLGGEMGIWRRRLDWVVFTSAEVKSATVWTEIVGRYEIGGAIIPESAVDREGSMDRFRALCSAKEIPVFAAGDGYSLDLGQGARLTILAEGGGGLLLAVDRGQARWLIPVGLDGETGRRLLAQGRIPSAQVLFPVRVASDWDAESWLWRVNPLVSISLSGGESGWPEDPQPLRVDTLGRIDLATEGKNLWVKASQ